MATATISPPLKWHGGKQQLADWIISLMPERCKNPNQPEKNLEDKGWLHYVEPFAGGLAVLLANDPEGVSEVANDLNAWLTNFWGVLGDDEAFAEFTRKVGSYPFSEALWAWADGVFEEWEKHGRNIVSTFPRLSVVGATAFFVRCRQSLAGRMKGFTGITRNRTRRGMNEQVSAWLNAIEGLPAVHARLKRVLILNRPALDVIRTQDGPRTLFYLDPPYLHETRATTGEYEHEMTADDHMELLDMLCSIKGRFMLSGYRSDLYDEYAKECGWTRHEKTLPNSAAGGASKRLMTECVWCNFAGRGD